MIVLRKVQHGRVKYNGKFYKPHVRLGTPAPKHLEGMVLAFGTYPPEHDCLSLWGTREMRSAKTEQEFSAAYKAALKLLTMRARAAIWDNYYSDAVFVWEWWTTSRWNRQR